jgi:outer membrane protein OmpA-like peptidoglycan-associated protein
MLSTVKAMCLVCALAVFCVFPAQGQQEGGTLPEAAPAPEPAEGGGVTFKPFRVEGGVGNNFFMVLERGEFYPSPGLNLGAAFFFDSAFGARAWGNQVFPLDSDSDIASISDITVGPSYSFRRGRFAFPLSLGLYLGAAGGSGGSGAGSAFNLGVGAEAGAEFWFTDSLYGYGRMQAAYGFFGGGDLTLTPAVGVGFAFGKPRMGLFALTLHAAPDPFSPDGDGIDDILTIRLGVITFKRVASWSVEIIEPWEPFAVFKRFEGKGRPPKRLVWNGRGNNGELVMSTQDYPIVFRAVDVQGNSASVDGKVTIKVDVLTEKEGDNLRLHASALVFSGNMTDFTALSEEALAKNEWILERLAELLRERYPEYQVTVEGYANPVLGTAREEREMLGPISAGRARFVMERLIALGVSRERLSSAGYGGTKLLVDWQDRANRWKNRRVEFLLTKRDGKAGGEKESRK